MRRVKTTVGKLCCWNVLCSLFFSLLFEPIITSSFLFIKKDFCHLATLSLPSFSLSYFCYLLVPCCSCSLLLPPCYQVTLSCLPLFFLVSSSAFHNLLVTFFFLVIFLLPPSSLLLLFLAVTSMLPSYSKLLTTFLPCFLVSFS